MDQLNRPQLRIESTAASFPALAGCMVVLLTVAPGCAMDAVGSVDDATDDASGDGSSDATEADLVADVTLLPFGSTFRYLSGAAPSGWQGTVFADATWASGAGEIGFGDGDEKTVIPRGPSGTVAYYFRARFNATPSPAWPSVLVR